jgi:WD40 repeat protein
MNKICLGLLALACTGALYAGGNEKRPREQEQPAEEAKKARTESNTNQNSFANILRMITDQGALLQIVSNELTELEKRETSLSSNINLLKLAKKGTAFSSNINRLKLEKTDTSPSSNINLLGTVSNLAVTQPAEQPTVSSQKEEMALVTTGNEASPQQEQIPLLQQPVVPMIQEKMFEHGPDSITSLTFNEHRLRCGGNDGSICTWDRNKKVWATAEKHHASRITNMFWHAPTKSDMICFADGTVLRSPQAGAPQTIFTSDEVPPIAHACLSSSNLELITGHTEGTIKIWDLSSKACTKTLAGHTNAITALICSPSHLISAALDKTLKIWDLKTGECIHTFKVPYVLFSLKWTDRDNLHCISGSQDGIKVWDISTKSMIDHFAQEEEITKLTKMNSLVIAGSFSGKITLWDKEKKCVGILEGLQDPISIISWDSSKHVLAATTAGTIGIWQRDTQGIWNFKIFKAPQGPDPKFSGPTSPKPLDKSKKATADSEEFSGPTTPTKSLGKSNSNSTAFSEASSPKPLGRSKKVTASKSTIFPVKKTAALKPRRAVSEDNSLAGLEKKSHVKKASNTAESLASDKQEDSQTSSREDTVPTTLVPLLSGEKALATKADKTESKVSATQETSQKAEEPKESPVSNPLENQVFAVSEKVSLEKAPEVQEQKTELIAPGKQEAAQKIQEPKELALPKPLALKLAFGQRASTSSPILCLAYSSLGKEILAGQSNGIIKKYATEAVYTNAKEMATGELAGNKKGVTHILCHPDNPQCCISGSYDGTIRVWDTAEQKCIQCLQGHARSITSLCINSNDKNMLGSTSEDGTLKLWDLKAATYTPLTCNSSLHSLVFLPDTQYAITASGNTIIVWDVYQKEFVSKIEGVTPTNITALCIHPTLQGHILIGTDNGTIFIFNLDLQIPIAELQEGTSPIKALSVDPHNSNQLFSSSKDNSIAVWNLATGDTIVKVKASGTINSFLIDKAHFVTGPLDGKLSLWTITRNEANEITAITPRNLG